MAYKALYNLFPDTSLISSPTILAHSAQLTCPPCCSHNSSNMLLPPGFLYSLFPLPGTLFSEMYTYITPFRSLCSNITSSEKPSLSALRKTAYIYISPFSISLFCVVFLSNIYQVFIICPPTPILQKISSMTSGPLLIMSSLPIIVPGTQYYNRL